MLAHFHWGQFLDIASYYDTLAENLVFWGEAKHGRRNCYAVAEWGVALVNPFPVRFFERNTKANQSGSGRINAGSGVVV